MGDSGVHKTAELTAASRLYEFIAVLSHELRNPLGAIRTSLYVLEHDRSRREDAVEARRVINRQVTHLVRMLDNLMDVARLAEREIQLERRRLDLNEVVRAAVEDGQAHFDTGEVRLETNFSAGPVYVRAESGAPRAGGDEPALQRGQVHPPGRRRAGVGRGRRRAQGPADGGRHRVRDRARAAAAPVRALRPGPPAPSTAGRAASASGWRWSSTSSAFTAARSAPRAPASTRAPSSSSGCRSTPMGRTPARGLVEGPLDLGAEVAGAAPRASGGLDQPAVDDVVGARDVLRSLGGEQDDQRGRRGWRARPRRSSFASPTRTPRRWFRGTPRAAAGPRRRCSRGRPGVRAPRSALATSLAGPSGAAESICRAVTPERPASPAEVRAPATTRAPSSASILVTASPNPLARTGDHRDLALEPPRFMIAPPQAWSPNIIGGIAIGDPPEHLQPS